MSHSTYTAFNGGPDELARRIATASINDFGDIRRDFVLRYTWTVAGESVKRRFKVEKRRSKLDYAGNIDRLVVVVDIVHKDATAAVIDAYRVMAESLFDAYDNGQLVAVAPPTCANYASVFRQQPRDDGYQWQEINLDLCRAAFALLPVNEDPADEAQLRDDLLMAGIDTGPEIE
jgi:hypothetical protein